MTVTLHQTFFNNELTEAEAYELINYNWKHGNLQKASKYQLNKIDELKRISNLGLVLDIAHPAWKENELYKLVNENWDLFTNLGTTKDFTPLLSFRSILYILNVYNFELKVDYSKLNKVAIKKQKVDFKYTEDQALSILKTNQEKLERSAGSKLNNIHQVTSPSVLASVLKLGQAGIYDLLRQHLPQLELLGCSKTTRYSLSYRGVVYLLLQEGYSLNITLEEDKPKVVYLPLKTPEQPVVEKKESNKADIELIKNFLNQKTKELRAKAEEDKKKADASNTNLKIVEDAYWHIEQAEELLEEVGL